MYLVISLVSKLVVCHLVSLNSFLFYRLRYFPCEFWLYLGVKSVSYHRIILILELIRDLSTLISLVVVMAVLIKI